MDPLSITASIIAVIQLTGSVISAAYNYRSGVNNAAEDAVRIIEHLTGLSQILEKLLKLLEKDRSTGSAQLASVNTLIRSDGPLEICQRRLTELKTKLQPENGWRAVRKALTWPLKQDYVRQTLDEIAKAKATIDLALSVDQTSMVLEVKYGMDNLTAQFESYQLDKDRKVALDHRKAILASLATTDPSVNHYHLRKKHEPGTGQWLLQGNQYLDWTDTINSVLWLNGIPGCGKSILCSIVIEDLVTRKVPLKQPTAVAYYYFNFQNREEQQLVNALRSMILQLSCQCQRFPSYVESLHYRLQWQHSQPSLTSGYLIGIVQQLLKEFKDVYLVMDALDECEQHEESLELVQELATAKDGILHLLVSSRQIQSFRSTIEPIATDVVSVNESIPAKDIQVHIREQLRKDPRMRKWPSPLQDQIEDTLMANVDGSFRWVSCHLDGLRKCLRPHAVIPMLETLPKSLNETYDRILMNIDEFYIEDARRILQWLVFSARPMHMNEVIDALAFDWSDPEEPCFDTNLRLQTVEDVLTICSSLIMVSNEKAESHQASVSELSEVRLAHHSVKDYLLSHRLKDVQLSHFAMEAHLAHTIIAKSCLVYLLQFETRLDTVIVERFPLVRYSAKFWPEHFNHSQSDDSLSHKLALRLLNFEDVPYRNCCSLHSPDAPWREVDLEKDEFPPVLGYVCANGLKQLAKDLLRAGSDPNQYMGYYGDALGAAAYQGNEEILQDLLGAGAIPDGNGYGYHGAPIAAAASEGHMSIVKLLIKAGADLDKRGGEGEGSALYAAASARRTDMVKMLLDAGASPNTFAGMSGVTHVIQVAAQRGDIEQVSLLLAQDTTRSEMIDLAMETTACARQRTLFEALLKYSKDHHSALRYAALGGWDDLVRLLLDESSKLQTGSYSTGGAFYEAAARGSLDTIQILFETKNEAELPITELSDAVYPATCKGHLMVVQYLLDRGADTERIQESLRAAADRGYVSIVKVLLDAGVKPNIEPPIPEPGRYHMEEPSPLYNAVSNNHADVARLLLSFDAQANTRHYGTPALIRSIQNNNEEIFNLLLENGASLEAGEPVGRIDYDTLHLLVHHAAAIGNEDILRKLLQSDLGVDDRLIDEGWTALFHAAKAGHDNILRILLFEYDADVKKAANGGIFAIHTAAFHNHPKCIEIFLEAGLDINVANDYGRTALHSAANQGSIDAVRFLVERGADVSLEERETGMRPVDFAHRKAFEVLQATRRRYLLGRDEERDRNYEPIVEILEARAE